MAPALGLTANLPAIGRPTPSLRPRDWSGGTRFRCSATSSIRPTSSVSTTSIRTRPRAASPGMISIGTFDNFNLAVAGIKGSLAPAATLIYETLMTKSQDEVVTEYGLLAEAVGSSRRLLLGHLPPAQGGAVARWQAGHAGGRDLLDRYLEAVQPDVRLLLPARRQGREGRRARYQVHLRRSGKSRTADHRRSAPGTAQALVGRHRQPGPQARHLGNHTGAAAGLRPLSDQGVRRSSLGHPRAREGLLGRDRFRHRWERTISTSCASSSFATIWSRWKRSRRIKRIGSLRIRPSNGRRNTTFRLSPRSGSSRKSSRSTTRAGCRHSSSICVATSSRMRGCVGRSITRSISRR